MKVIINGTAVEVKGEKTVLEAARENGFDIPSLCDFPRLIPFTGCRLCIVKIEGRKGFPPSCGTAVEEGMNIKTDTPTLQKLRKMILELILSEHPNACLICSEKSNCDEYKSTIRKVSEVTGCALCSNNRRCDLQNVVEAMKIDSVRFPSLYRDFEVKKSDPFFDRNYNLCILCGRCVRVCHEVRGASAISFVYRGSQAIVGTAFDRSLLESGCQFCGACVDICPTGSLTERAVKYESLPDAQSRTICPLCSLGCELDVDLKKGRILSTRPSLEGPVNQGQGCVKGRFIIPDVVHSPHRILKPMIRKNTELEEVNWEEALEFTAKRLKNYRKEVFALIASPQAACEDQLLFHRFASEVMQSHTVRNPEWSSLSDSLEEFSQKHGISPRMNFKIQEIAEAKAIFLVGTDIVTTHPIIWLEVLKAVKNGGRLVVLGPAESGLNRFASHWIRSELGREFALLNSLTRAVLGAGRAEALSQFPGHEEYCESLETWASSRNEENSSGEESKIEEAAKIILDGEPAAFIFGRELIQTPARHLNLAALWNLSLCAGARLFPLSAESNERGLDEFQRCFAEGGLEFSRTIQRTRDGSVKALYLAGPFPYTEKSKVEFLVVQDSYWNETSRKADVIFPSGTFAEREGTFVNTEGRLQHFDAVIEPVGEAKPDWWIISRLAQKMGHKGLSFDKSAEILAEIQKSLPGFSKASFAHLKKHQDVFLQDSRKKGQKDRLIAMKWDAEIIKSGRKYPFLMVVDYGLDSYKNLNLSQEIKGFRWIRDSRWIFLSPADAEELALKTGDSVEVESTHGKLQRIVKVAEHIPQKRVRTQLSWNGDPDFITDVLTAHSSADLISQRLIPVNIRRG